MRKADTNSVTQKMVAERAGVSFITVSRVISDPGKVAIKTRQRVEAAIKETGYVLNTNARALARNGSKIVGVIIPTVTNNTYASLVTGVDETLKKEGYGIVLGQTLYDQDEENRLVRTMLGHQLDAIILYSGVHLKNTKDILAASGLPVTEVWHHGRTPIDMSSAFSMVKTGIQAANHLLSRGYRNLAYYGGRDHSDTLRWRGFSKVVYDEKNANATYIRTSPDDKEMHSFDKGDIYLAAIKDNPNDIDAVFCSSDTMGAAIVFEATKRNLDIPSDLGVCGFGGVALSSGMIPALTTVQVPSLQMGIAAAKQTLDAITGRAILHKRIKHTTRVIKRDTT